jgi:hypothetical protein
VICKYYLIYIAAMQFISLVNHYLGPIYFLGTSCCKKDKPFNSNLAHNFYVSSINCNLMALSETY